MAHEPAAENRTEAETPPRKNVLLDMDKVMVDGLRVRPGLRTFLEFLFSNRRVATVSVWTASFDWWCTIYESRIDTLMPELEDVHRVTFHFVWGDRSMPMSRPSRTPRCGGATGR